MSTSAAATSARCKQPKQQPLHVASDIQRGTLMQHTTSQHSKTAAQHSTAAAVPLLSLAWRRCRSGCCVLVASQGHTQQSAAQQDRAAWGSTHATHGGGGSRTLVQLSAALMQLGALRGEVLIVIQRLAVDGRELVQLCAHLL